MKNIIVAVFTLLLGVSFAHAADTPPTKEDALWLAEVRTSVKSEKYDRAISLLKTANDTSSADWNNLMGYSLRKKQPPDLVGAEKYYQAALVIDPKHRGALEYYGELKLMNNDLPGAEVLLARLDKACFFGCEEYADLKEAIKKYKAKK
jgi:Flp pilus assembly protein TadD